MGATSSSKKRKLQEVNDAAKTAKKTKKIKSPAPPVEPPSEDEEEDEEDVLSDEAESNEGSDGEAAGLDDRDAEEGDDDIPTVNAPLLPPTTTSDKFEDMNLSEKSMRAITAMGFTTMTKIQRSVSGPTSTAAPTTN